MLSVVKEDMVRLFDFVARLQRAKLAVGRLLLTMNCWWPSAVANPCWKIFWSFCDIDTVIAYVPRGEGRRSFLSGFFVQVLFEDTTHSPPIEDGEEGGVCVNNLLVLP